MKRFWGHIRTYIFRGLLAIIPIVLSFFAVQFLYLVIDKRVMGWVDQLIGFSIPGLGILIVFVVLYLLGFIASNVIGKEIFGGIERLTSRIPVIKTTYQAGKQLALTLSATGKQEFKRVVLINYLMPGMWAIGFVTGTIVDNKNDEKLLKVFVPSPPNPATGFMVVVRESQVRDPGWTVEEALKTVISGGIIGASEIKA